MIDFDPQEFRDIYDKYPETWDIVSSPQVCLLMRDMVKIELPAIEALHHAPDFLNLVVRVDSEQNEESRHRFRKMIGRMCRQVMEHLGYIWQREGVRTRLSPIFSQGSTYMRKGE